MRQESPINKRKRKNTIARNPIGFSLKEKLIPIKQKNKNRQEMGKHLKNEIP